jgi:hypothetical protein
MQKNSLCSGVALARTVLPITLICALGAASARAQTTNVTWDRQALGQTVGGSCGPATNLTHWSVTYPNDNNWSQSQVLGSTACGTEIVAPSNWSIPGYPNSTNYDVLIGAGGVVNLDVSVTVNDLAISSGELDIPSQSLLHANTIELESGTILGSLQNSGAMTMSNGLLAGAIVNTGTIASPGTGTNIVANQTILSNQGLVQQNNNGGLGFNGYGGGTTAFYNLAAGTFQFLNDSPVFLNNCCGTVFFENQGLVWKSNGTNNAIISIAFDNLGGAIRVDTGKLTLSDAGGNSNGTFTVAEGAVLDLTGGSNPTWAGRVSGGGAGQVVVGSGIITASPSLTLDFTNGLFNTSGGTLAGTIVNDGTVTSVGTNASILANEATFLNQALFQQNGSGGLGFNGYGGGTTAFNNLVGATFEFLTDSSVFQNTCCGTLEFNNEGLLWKSGGPNDTTVSIPFNNAGGTIQVDTGELTLSGGGSSSNGTFMIANGATLDLTGGNNPTWAGQMSGAGTGHLLAGIGTITASPSLTLDFTNGLFNTSGGTLAGMIVNEGTVTSVGTNASILANEATFLNQALFQQSGSGGLGFNGYGGGTTAFNNLAGATFQFLTDSSVFQNTCCGTLDFNNQGLLWKSGGSNNTTVSVSFNNSGGTIRVDTGKLTLSGGGSSSNGTFTVAGGAVLDLTGGSRPTWVGQMTGSGAGNVVLSSGTILAQPNLNLNFPSSLFEWNGGTFAGAVSNLGVVNLTGPAVSMLANQSLFFNQNLVQAHGSGGLGLNGYGGGTTAFYNLPAATYQVLTDSPISLASCCGTVFFENQGLLWKSGGVSNTAVGITFNNLGGTIEVDTGQLTLGSGGSSSNATVIVEGGATLDLTGGNNSTYWAGQINGGGAGSVVLSSGTIIGTPLVLNCASNLFQWNGGTFFGEVINMAAVNLSGAAASILANQAAFYNNGLVRQSGSGGLGLDGYGGGTTAFYNSPGATYQLLTDSSIFLASCCGTVFFENQGLLWKSGGASNTTVSIAFESEGGTVKVDSGQLTLSGAGSSSNATFTIAGGAAVDLTGGNDPTWAGQINGSGAGSVFLSTGTIIASPSLTLALSNNLFQWSGGTFTGTVSNAAVVTLSSTNNSILANQSVFYNNGLILHAGSGALGLNGYGGGTTAFYNLANGTYQFLTDSSVFENNCCGTLEFNNQGLVRKAAGTNTSLIAIPFNNLNGSLEVDSGTLSLNGSPYSQGTGALTVALGGPNPGQCGQLEAGIVALAGPLNVYLTNSFAPAIGSRFQILSCASLSGAFSSISAPTNLAVSYTSNGVFLTVTNTIVNQSLQITSGQLSGGHFTFGFPTINNQSYTVQQNTNLASTNWLLYSNFIGNGSAVQLAVPVSTAPQQFFRVREP